ncbi:hypothetical protein BaRGS_00020649 [Batillaria attramentaria]|uniref:Peptidase S54 rhomboid domain-containing protein n=1 Tax=Batillaria attramentaria TaxID=370345 RepID=A0ABD0KM04_9CAEN
MLKYWRERGSGRSTGRTRDSTVFSVEEDLTELDRQVRQNLEQRRAAADDDDVMLGDPFVQSSTYVPTIIVVVVDEIILLGIISKGCSAETSGKTDRTVNREDERQPPLLSAKRHFRPVFQRFVYGGERIASHDLRRILQDDFYRDMLPPDKVYELIDLVDFNPGKAISYTEFVRIVTGGFDTDFNGDQSSSQKHGTDTPKTWLNTVCRNTVNQAEVDEYLKTYRWLPPPFFMVTISLVQLIVFIYYAVDIADKGSSVGALDGVAAYSDLMYLPTKRHEPWRFVTYMFLHQGWWRLLIVYVIGVIVGSLAQSVCDHQVGLAGAAGGAYAVVIAHVVALIANYSELDSKRNIEKRAKNWWGRPLFRLVVIILVVLVQTSLAVFRRFYPDFPAYKVGVAAHGGGIVAGYLLGRPFLTDNLRYPWQKNAGWLDLFILMIFIGACIIFNILYDGYPEAEY